MMRKAKALGGMVGVIYIGRNTYRTPIQLQPMTIYLNCV